MSGRLCPPGGGTRLCPTVFPSFRYFRSASDCFSDGDDDSAKQDFAAAVDTLLMKVPATIKEIYSSKHRETSLLGSATRRAHLQQGQQPQGAQLQQGQQEQRAHLQQRLPIFLFLFYSNLRDPNGLLITQIKYTIIYPFSSAYLHLLLVVKL